MTSYTEYRDKYGKVAADSQARRQGFSESQISNESKAYEENDAILSKGEKGFWDKYKETRNNVIDWFIDFSAAGASAIHNSVMSMKFHSDTDREFTPAPPPPNNTAGKVGSTVFGVAADSLVYGVGGAVGSFTPIPQVTAPASAFALEEGLRSYYSQERAIDKALRQERKKQYNLYLRQRLAQDLNGRESYVNALRNGKILNIDDVADVVADESLKINYGEVALESGKGAILGAALGYVGGKATKFAENVIGGESFAKATSSLTPKGKAVAQGLTKSSITASTEVATMGTVAPLTEFKVPTQQDFIDAALMIGSLKLTKTPYMAEDYYKAYNLRQLSDYATKLKAVRKEGVTSAEVNYQLYKEAERKDLIEKALRRKQGLRQDNLEDALQLEYIKSNKSPLDTVNNIMDNKAEFQRFVLMANEIAELGGLENALRNPAFRDKHIPKKEFTPIEAKEKQKKEGEVENTETSEMFVGGRNKKIENKIIEAENLIQEGKLTPEEIRQKTGIEVLDVKDNKGETRRLYMYEIDDSKSKLNIDTKNIKNNSVYTLEQVFKHDELYEFYPWLRDVRVKFSIGDDGDRGYFNPRNMEVWYNLKYIGDSKQLRKTLLHEIQHIAQDYEGWYRGGSPRAVNPVMPEDVKPYYERRMALVPYLRKGLQDKGYEVVERKEPVYLDVWRYEMENIARENPEYAKAYNEFMELLKQTDIYEAKMSFEEYVRLGGENQARNTSRRADYSPEQRKAIPPQATQDFPNGSIVVRFGDKLYPIGDYVVGEMNKSQLYPKGDKMNIYIGEKAEGTYIKAENLENIVNGLINDLWEGDRPAVFKERFAKGKNTLGVYYQRQNYVRIRDDFNISVISHELAHQLENKALGGIGKFFPEKYEKELSRIATKGGNLSEGFAEMLSYFIIDPEYVKKTTPEAYKYFVETMQDKFPDKYKTLVKYQEMMKAYQEQPSLERVKGTMRSKIESKKDAYTTAEHIYTETIDDLHPVKIASNVIQDNMTDMQKQSFNKDNADPYPTMRRLRGISERVKSWMEGRPVDFKGNVIKDSTTGKHIDSLTKITKGMSEQELENFEAFLKVAHSVELRGRQTGVDPNEAKYLTAEMKAKYGEKAKKVYKLMDEALKYAKDSGLITEEQYTYWRNQYPAYIPMKRAIEGPSMGTDNVLGSQPIKSYRGSDVATLRPIIAIEEYIGEIIIAAEKNKILTQLADLTTYDSSGIFIRAIPEKGKVIHLPKGKKVVSKKKKNTKDTDLVQLDPASGDIIGIWGDQGNSVYIKTGADAKDAEFGIVRNGRIEVYKTDRFLFEALTGSLNSKEEVGAVKKLIQEAAMLPTKLTRAGAVLKPTFIVRNYFIDQFTATMNSKHGYRPFVDSLYGAIAITSNKIKSKLDSSLTDQILDAFGAEYAQNWKNYGGSQTSFYSKAINGDYTKAIKKYYDEGWTSRVFNSALNPVEGLRILSEFIENSTRVGEFRRAYDDYIKQGFTPEVAREKAAFDARDVTVDFARAGSYIRELNKYKAFLNATIQGNNKLWETAKNNPKRMAFLLMGTALSFVALEMYNKNDEEIQAINNNIHDTSLVFRYGDAIIKLPIIRELVGLKMLIRRFFQEEGFYNFGKDVSKSVVDSYAMPDMADIILATQNKDLYRGTDIIPQSLVRLTGEYQFTSGTTETAKWMAEKYRDITGDKTGPLASPINIDYWSNMLSGGLIGQAYRGIDNVAFGDKFDPYKEKKGILKSSFMVMYAPSTSKYTPMFYDILDELEKYKNVEERDILSKDKIDPADQEKRDFYEDNAVVIEDVLEAQKERTELLKQKYKTKEDADFAKDEVLKLDQEIIKNTRQFVLDYLNKFGG